ncbi:hypothetical protein BC941DRAFT_36372 [Chlamydoabsidia padenii]|nr:hypothetical protein BC941DRAFT_36372 [Chlamydoabsidia padenii]
MHSSATARKDIASYWIHHHSQDTTAQDHLGHSSETSSYPAFNVDHSTTQTTGSLPMLCSHDGQEEVAHPDLINKNTTSSSTQQPLFCDTAQLSTQIQTDRVIKQDALLCMGLIRSGNENLPTRYKKRDANSYKRQEDWRQLETVLTSAALACYDSTALSWPDKTLVHWIPLNDQDDPDLSLYLLSSSDFTFCIQYTSAHTNQPLTLIFRARSFGLCQEWYMTLYQLFPTKSRKPLPQTCDIYLPTLDLRVHLPLSTDHHIITMDQVKETVVDFLQLDPNWRASFGKGHSDFSLCWTRKDRAEWIFWNTSVDRTCRSDSIFCPQLIEKSHQLELRPAQHTPHTIVLNDNTSLQEPPPCEGFLTMMTDFEGRRLKPWAPQHYYFASFGRLLFVIPSDKAIVPDSKNFANMSSIDPDATGLGSFYMDWVENDPWVNMVTPFALTGGQLDEIDRRTRLMTAAFGYIDLTQLAYIQRSTDQHYHDLSGDVSSGLHADPSSSSSLLQHHNGEPMDSSRQQLHSMELVMKNGITIRLKAYSSDTCDLWITCISNLMLYSNASVEATRDATTYSPDKEAPTVPSSVGESSVSIDTRIWSLCLYTQCHEVAKSGILYIQSKGAFSQKHFVLTVDGQLHYFNVYKRAGDNGKPIRTGLHDRKGILELTGAYVYSGLVSSLANKQSPLLDLPLRLFDDGVTTNDSNEDCLFTIWIPKRRRVYSTRRQNIITYGPHQRFPSKGTRWLFLAPTRHEKEHWMWAISVIQEQLLRGRQ